MSTEVGKKSVNCTGDYSILAADVGDGVGELETKVSASENFALYCR